MEQLNADDMLLENNVNNYNLCIKIVNDMKTFDKNMDLNTKVKFLIKE